VRISHRELEECLRNPSKWVAYKAEPTGGGPRAGYDYCLREGIYHLHKFGNSSDAQQNIQKLIKSFKLRNLMRVDDVTQRFNAYITWLNKAGVVVADQRFRINSDLGSGLILGGVISRIDMTAEGYRAVLLGPIKSLWRDELRMPLIQRIVAKAYGRSEVDFSVGCQELDASNMGVISYSSADIDQAEERAQSLATTIKIESAKYIWL
jgi:hypothetical protein